MFPLRKSANVIAERLTKVFAEHDIPPSQIPRLLPSIQYKDLHSEKTLLTAITPTVIDSVANLFVIRSAWLEGVDDLIYHVHGARGNLKELLSCLGDAIACKCRHFPLRVLTTSMSLDKQGKHLQLLLPVIVETVNGLGENFVHRCHVFGTRYDWAYEAHRIELKAIAWVV